MTNMLLSGAALITLALCWLSVTGRFPMDTDSTGVTALFIFLTFPRWFAIAGVLRILLNKGEFQWISTCRLTQELSVFGTHALLGVAVLSANVVVHSGSAPEDLRSILLLFATLVPVLTVVYACALTNPGLFTFLPEDGLRKAACSMVVVGAVLLLSVTVARLGALEDTAAAKAAAKPAASDVLAELNALPGNAPISAYLSYLGGRYPAEVGATARRRIMMRARYQQELTELLANPEWSLQALGFVRTNVLMPSPALAPAAAEAIRLLAEQVSTQLANGAVATEERFGNECRLALEIADRFPAQAHLFVEPLRAMYTALQSQERAISPGVCRELREWLDRHSHEVLEARISLRWNPRR